jgi:hypothetical protein
VDGVTNQLEIHIAHCGRIGPEGKVWTPLVDASKMSVHMPCDASEQTKGFAFVEYGSQKVRHRFQHAANPPQHPDTHACARSRMPSSPRSS